MLQMTASGIPVWVDGLKTELQVLGERLTEQARQISQRIDSLSLRVVDALERAQTSSGSAPVDAAAIVPWGQSALDYLCKRKAGAADSPCPLPELFAALREKHPEVKIAEYHTGLRRLHDRGLVRLLPVGNPSDLVEPEYALLDGANTFYHVA